ncbi:MAG: 2-hydroxyacyl-CoA dehydratase [Nitrospirae bacterium]|nr:2-hydroxyacyl-CoA dehydratase [Nitrospirota bacterium]
MTSGARGRIGFACAYTPLPLIHAMGFAPYRVLPMGRSPEEAGRWLHDNLCPHVKRILDRALSRDLPELAGIVFVESCDAMRRLEDAWRAVRPNDRVASIDLPTSRDEASVAFFAREIRNFAHTLAEWGGDVPDHAALVSSIGRYNALREVLENLARRSRAGTLVGGSARLQKLYNTVVTEPPEDALAAARLLTSEPESNGTGLESVPVFLFGHVLPDPEAFALLESCGARIVSDDLCTGSRMISRMEEAAGEDEMLRMARGLLAGPACARTFDPAEPGRVSREVAERAKACGARGVIGHVVKFCDPYLARIPAVREALAEEGIPFLALEGDCTLGSIGQQKTRIEAFVEMLR